MGALQTPILVSLKTILVATDFSASSDAALHYAAAIARRHQSRVLLEHVVAAEARPAIPIEPLPPELDQLRHEAEQQLEQQLRDPALAGLPCEPVLERGTLWQALENSVEERKVDLLVAGTHGRVGLKKVLMGSAAEEIFRFATCPVLTVGPHVDPMLLAGGKLQHVLYATDFSAGSLHALPYALALAREDEAALTVLHVVTATVPTELATMETISYHDKLVDDARRQLEKVASEHQEPGIKPELLVACGTPADCILRKAAERNSSLIVMGVHAGAVRTASHVPWTVAHRVVCQAHCPVLTVRGR